jgi:hypothetical protein
VKEPSGSPGFFLGLFNDPVNHQDCRELFLLSQYGDDPEIITIFYRELGIWKW